jgi:hypothetical protein
MSGILRTVLLALLLAGATGLLSGCATDDPDGNNIDRKPWSTPPGWGGPLPSSLGQGR